jgi:acyl-CoA thioesterase-1
MRKKVLLVWLCFGSLIFSMCSDKTPIIEEPDKTIIDDNPKETEAENNTLNILALGDSYTIGESVCSTCRFPEQLKDSIAEKIGNTNIKLEIIARTGWTTTALKDTITNSNIPETQDLVTLLIGVNNQYQRQPFSIFEQEFPQLVSSAIKYAKGDIEKVIIVSIPDYAFTPWGNGDDNISKDIDKYNDFIKSYCETYSVTYVYITDITRKGLEQIELVASDGLHPSAVAYSKFVEGILPKALEKIGYISN